MCKDAKGRLGMCKDAKGRLGMCKDGKGRLGMCKDAEIFEEMFYSNLWRRHVCVPLRDTNMAAGS